MLTPLHRALGREPGELTPELFEQAIAAKIAETSDLDWKSELYNPKNPKWADEAAKDIAAMANSGGGWIVFGIDEAGAEKVAAKPTPVQWSDSAEQKILQVAFGRIGPPVLGIEFYPVEVVGGSIVAMRIPDSRDVPHLARKGDSAFVAPVRNGAHTAFMGAGEIEQALRRRLATDKERGEQLDDLFDRASTYLDPEDGVCLVLVAMPLEPSTDRTPLTRDEAQGHNDSHSPAEFFSNGIPHEPFFRASDTRRTLRGWLIRGGNLERRMIRKSLHDDGSVLASYRTAYDGDPNSRAANHFPVGLPNHCMSRHLEEATADFSATLRRHAAGRDVNGGYLIRAGLIGQSGEPIYVRTVANQGDFLLKVDFSVPIHEFQVLTTELDPLAAVEDLVRTVSELTLDIINQGGVQYLRILSPPPDVS